MSNFAGAFKGMSTAKVTSGRTPNPALGKAVYLIDSVRMHDGRTGGYRAQITASCLWGIDNGLNSAGEDVPCNKLGDPVATCIFSGERFQQDFKKFALTACGCAPHNEMDVVDLVCPASDFPEGTDPLTRLETAWDSVLPGMICAFDSNGEPTDAGVFDGQVAVEIVTVENAVTQKVNNKGPDDKSNWVFDADGNPIVKVYTNTYFNRKVPMAEVGETLDEAGIKRMFGTVEKFGELLKADG